jgi:hypothetical protein
MARRCECDAILEMMARDPRLRGLPLAARALWLELLLAMRSLGASALRFGSVVPDAREIALLVAISESELEANLEPILQRGLLERASDGALSSPLLAAAMHRSDVNRANGLKGGAVRKRKAEEARQRLLPLMSVASGGGASAASVESELEPNPQVGTSLSLSLETAEKLKPKAVVSDTEFHRIGLAAFEAAGFDPVKSPANYGIVRQWLADGADEATILSVIGRKAHGGVSHLGYFTKAITAAVASRPQEIQPLSAKSRAYDDAVHEWFANGMKGEMPHPSHFAADGSRAAKVA